MLRVAPIETEEERAAWEVFSTKSPAGHLHQSFCWAGPLERYRIHSRVLGCWSGGELVGGGLFRSVPVPFTGATLTECLDGPVFSAWERGWAEPFVAALAELARRTRSLVVTIEGCPDREIHADVVAAMRRTKIPVELSTGDTRAIVDLNGETRDDLLQRFSYGVRRNIRKALKNEVRVRRLEEPGEQRQAYEAWCASSARKGFSHLRPWSTLGPVVRGSSDGGFGSVLASFAGDRMLAAVFITHVGRASEYIYGGHFDDVDRYSPNHILHYEAMGESLARGIPAYNLGKIQKPQDPLQHGVDRFKHSFRPESLQNSETIGWLTRPRSYRAMLWLKRRPLGKKLKKLARRWLTR